MQLNSYAGPPAEVHVPTEWLNKILHACLNVGESVQIAIEDPLEAERIFHALAENGLPVSACSSIDSVYRGWLTVSKPRLGQSTSMGRECLRRQAQRTGRGEG